MADVMIQSGGGREAVSAFEAILKAIAAAGVQVDKINKQFVTLNLASETVDSTLKGVSKSGDILTATLKALGTAQEDFKLSVSSTNAATDKQIVNMDKAARAAKLFRSEIQKGFTRKDVAGKGATFMEQFNLKQAEQAIFKLIKTQQLSAVRARQILADIKQGYVRNYGEGTEAAVKAILRLKQAQDAVGISARKQALKAAAAQQKAAAAADKANRKIQTGLKSSTKTVKTATTATREFTLSWRSLARITEIALFRRLVFAMTAQLREATNTAREFSKAIGELRTISQNAQLQTEEWEQGLIKLSNAFGLDILDITEAAYQTLSNQVAEGAQTFDFMTEALKFGIVTQTSATDSVNLLTAAINAYGLSSKDAGAVAASFFKTIELGRVRGDELANSFGRIGILGKQVGVQLEELQAAVTSLTIRGLKFSEVSTQIRGVLLKLIKPTVEMKKLFKDIGVESGEAAIKAFGFIGFLKILAARTEGSTTELGKFISRIRGLIGAVGLMNDGYSTMVDNYKEIKQAQDDYAKAGELVFETLGKKVDKIFSELKNTITQTYGKPILEFFVFLNDNLIKTTELLHAFANVVTGVAIIGITRYIGKIGLLSKAMSTLNPYIIVTAIAYASMKTAIDSMVDSIDEEIQAQLEATKRMEEASEAAIVAAGKRFDFLQESMQHFASEAAASIAKITKQLRKEVTEQEVDVKKATKVFEDAYKGAIKSITLEIKKIGKEQKELQRTFDQMSDFLNDFRSDISRTIFEYNFAQLQNVDVQFDIILKRIKLLQSRATQAAKDNNVEVLKDSFNRIKELQLRLANIDNKALVKQKQAQQKLRDIKSKAEEKLSENSEKLAEASHKKSKSRINSLRKQRAKISIEATEEQRKQQEELSILASNRLGEFSSQLETNLQKLMSQAESTILAAQTRIQSELLKIEEKKRKAELRHLFLVARFKDIRGQKLDETFFAQTSIEINKSFEERVLRVKELVTELKAAEQIEAATLLNKQLQEESELVKTRLQAVRIREEQKANNDNLVEIQKTIDLLNQQATLQQGNLEKYKKAISILSISQGRFKDVNRALLNFAANAPRIYTMPQEAIQKWKNLTAVMSKLTAASDKFIATGKGTDEYVKLIRESSKQLETIPHVYTLAGDASQDVINKQKNLNNLILRLFQGELKLGRALPEVIKVFKTLDGALKAQEQSQDKRMETTRKANEVTILTVNQLTNKYSELTKALQRAEEAQKALVEAQKRIVPEPTQPTEPFARGTRTSSTDTIPAMLSPGEFVMNAKASRRFYSQLVGMNRAQGFARGGPVGGPTFSGDFNINYRSSGNESVDVVRLGKLLRRGIQRGTVRLT